MESCTEQSVCGISLNYNNIGAVLDGTTCAMHTSTLVVAAAGRSRRMHPGALRTAMRRTRRLRETVRRLCPSRTSPITLN